VSAFGIDHQRSEAEALRQAGLTVWSVEYRRVGDPGGGWPGTFEDVGAAIDHLRELARRYPIDLGRVVLVGHSAGGHLALWAAGRGKLPPGTAVRGPNPLPVAGVVSLAGVGDLKAALDTKPPTCGDGVTRLVGESTPDRLKLVSPVELLPLGMPQEVISGADDAIVPPAWATEYGRRATAAGDRVTVTIIPDAGHFEVVSPTAPAWKVVQAAVVKLANR
jgi:acetyl esterase/lipase